MTVASANSCKTYAGDNVSTSFATSPVVFFDTSDLEVFVTTDATGVSTQLTENTHYSVTGGDGATGTVSLAGGSSPHGALLSGTTLIILRVIPITQSVDFVNGDNSDAEVAERALDRLTMVEQQHEETLARAIRLPAGDASGSTTELPASSTRAGRLLGFDATGLLTTFIVQIGTSIVDLASSIGSSLIGFIQLGTGAVLRTLQDKFRDSIDIRDFGCACDAVDPGNNSITGTDDTANLVLAIAAAVAQGKNLVHSHGFSKITSSVTIPDDLNFRCTGDAKFLYTGTGFCFQNGVVGTPGGPRFLDLKISLHTSSSGGLYLLNSRHAIVNLNMQGYLPASGLASDYAARTNIGLKMAAQGADNGWNFFPNIQFNHFHTGILEVPTVDVVMNNNHYGHVFFFGDVNLGDTGSVFLDTTDSQNNSMHNGSVEYWGDKGFHFKGTSSAWKIGPLWIETPFQAGRYVALFDANTSYNRLFFVNAELSDTVDWLDSSSGQSNTVTSGFFDEFRNTNVKNLLKVGGLAQLVNASIAGELRVGPTTTFANYERMSGYKSIDASATVDLCSIELSANFSAVILDVRICGTGGGGFAYYASGQRRVGITSGSIALTTLGVDLLAGLTFTCVWVSGNKFKLTATETNATTCGAGWSVGVHGGGANHAEGHIVSMIAL